MIIRSIFYLGLVSMGALPHFEAASVPALPATAIHQRADGDLQKTVLARLNDMKGEFKANANNVMAAGNKVDLDRVAGVIRPSFEAGLR